MLFGLFALTCAARRASAFDMSIGGALGISGNFVLEPGGRVLLPVGASGTTEVYSYEFQKDLGFRSPTTSSYKTLEKLKGIAPDEFNGRDVVGVDMFLAREEAQGGFSFWNGSAWGAQETALTSRKDGYYWWYTLPTPAQGLRPGSYRARLHARASNGERLVSDITRFQIDPAYNGASRFEMTTPLVEGATYSSLVSINFRWPSFDNGDGQVSAFADTLIRLTRESHTPNAHNAVQKLSYDIVQGTWTTNEVTNVLTSDNHVALSRSVMWPSNPQLTPAGRYTIEFEGFLRNRTRFTPAIPNSPGYSISGSFVRYKASFYYDPAGASATGWTATDAVTGPDNKTRVLWTNPAGWMRVWTVNPDYSVETRGTPYLASLSSGARPRAVSVNGAGDAFVLINESNGTSSVARFTAAGQMTHKRLLATGSGSVGVDLVNEPNGDLKVLWSNNNSAWAVERFNGVALLDASLGYAALSPTGVRVNHGVPGWNAQAMALGADGKTRLLLAHTDGRFAFWALDSQHSFLATSPVANGVAGWTTPDIGVHSDGSVRLLRAFPSPSAPLLQFWNIDTAYALRSAQQHSIPAGWSVKSLSVSPGDGKLRSLFAHTSGISTLWTVLPTGVAESGSPFLSHPQAVVLNP